MPPHFPLDVTRRAVKITDNLLRQYRDGGGVRVLSELAQIRSYLSQTEEFSLIGYLFHLVWIAAQIRIADYPKPKRIDLRGRMSTILARADWVKHDVDAAVEQVCQEISQHLLLGLRDFEIASVDAENSPLREGLYRMYIDTWNLRHKEMYPGRTESSRKVLHTQTAPLIRRKSPVKAPAPQNKRRLANRDLSKQQFAGADLRGQDFSRSNLAGADLSGANLSGANLTGADFSGANLQGANLQGARGQQTKFHVANLTGANLQQARFTEVLFDHVSLCNADLSTAQLERFKMCNTNLSGCKIGRVFLDTNWDGIIENTGLNQAQGLMANRLCIIHLLSEVDAWSGVVEKLMSALCYQDAIETWLILFSDLYPSCHREWDERLQDGRIDPLFHFWWKIQCSVLHQRIQNRDFSEFLYALGAIATDPVIKLHLWSDIPEVAAQGFSGLKISQKQMDEVTGGWWDRQKWTENRTRFHPRKAPHIPRELRSAVFSAMDKVDVSFETLATLLRGIKANC